MDLSNKNVMVIDNGLFVDFARHIAKGFKKVRYSVPWQSYAPKSTQAIVGNGFDEIEMVKYPLDHADDTDLWVFLDLYHCDLQCFLESHGARVWGGRNGEEMECHRWEFKQHLKKLGLPVQNCELVIGMDDLHGLLKEVKNKYVKSSFFRGDLESFRHDEYDLSKPHLDEIGHSLGPLQSEYEFIVEDEIDNAIEIGYDGFCIDGQWPQRSMVAYEVKDVGMIGCAMEYKDLPEPVVKVNKVLSPTFKGYKYRGFFCSEIRYGKDKKPYLIDPTCRLGTPSNELLQTLFDGWPEVLWQGAEGVCVTPKMRKMYAVAAVISSEHAVEGWQAVRFPKEIDRFVKLRFHCKIDGVDYTAPQPTGNPYPGVVLGEGNSLVEAVKHCKDNAEKVKGFGITIKLDSIDKALEVIKQGEKVGFRFGYQKVPDRL